MVAMLPFIATVQRFLVTILPFMTADLFPWEKRKKEKAAASNVEESNPKSNPKDPNETAKLKSDIEAGGQSSVHLICASLCLRSPPRRSLDLKHREAQIWCSIWTFAFRRQRPCALYRWLLVQRLSIAIDFAVFPRPGMPRVH
eukprot:3940340-Rhodomonas_salina.7